MKKFFKFGCLGIIALIVLGIIIAVATSGGDDSSNAPAKVDGSTGSAKKEKAQTTFKLGDTIQLGDHKVTVTKLEKSAGGEFETPKGGNEFVIVHLTIENGGKDQISYNPYDFQLKNSQGNIVDPGFITIDQDTALESGELAAGGKVQGTISFEAPQNDSDLDLIFTPSFWSDKKITINLN
ncbi:DUF4352 domain-containing protein [Falsibacillus pallidus]|uniref:Uncharacterized protein DUF4352 n=1 Tax=Falsibacillus pallidus TaxID=493781 RepID=A0A370G8G0_9BACI|nr:DUF4352 domain-containing protein [Falsibacillus pallidus]RDI40047.1 uncharacterized protein DUF4352 [Falsibacillus pallidus]